MFSYNIRTGNIYEFEKRIVRWEKDINGVLRFYTIQKKCKCYFCEYELKEFCKTVKWLIEKCGCDFGEDVNNYITAFCGI